MVWQSGRFYWLHILARASMPWVLMTAFTIASIVLVFDVKPSQLAGVLRSHWLQLLGGPTSA